MLTCYGYAVKKDGRYLGLNPKSGKMQFYKRPRFPVVTGTKDYAEFVAFDHPGEVVKVKLAIQEVQ